MPNTTRRKFIINSVLLGIGLPIVPGLFSAPPSNSFFNSLKDIKIDGGGFYYAGMFETPIQEGECVKDLVQDTSFVLPKARQLEGCIVVSYGEVFVVIDGRYCHMIGLE